MPGAKRAGFTVFELLVTIVMLSILSAMLFNTFGTVSESRYEMEARARFNAVYDRMVDALSERNRVVSGLYYEQFTLPLDPASPPDPADPATWVAASLDAIPDSGGIDLFRMVPSSGDPERERFWGVGKDEAMFSASFFLILQGEGSAVSSTGVAYPYKTYTLVYLGPAYRNFKGLVASGGAAAGKKFFSVLFRKDEGGGYSVREVPDESNPDYESVIKAITKKSDIEEAKTVWAGMRGKIITASVSTREFVERLVNGTVKGMEGSAATIEDWAAIQARKAAYDSINGNNFDRDYFVTCIDEGCDLGAVKMSHEEAAETLSVDYTRSLRNDLGEGGVPSSADQMQTADFGFFVCSDNGSGGCSSGKPYAMSQSGTVFEYATENGLQVYTAEGGLPVNGESSDGKMINPAMRPIASVYGRNEFGMPVLFTNAPSMRITSQGVSGGETYASVYVVNNVPLNEKESSPPYRASLVTVFPWFLGGRDCGGFYCVTDGGKGDYGIYHKPLFAHIF